MIVQPNQKIKIKDIASIFCTDKKIHTEIMEIKVHDVNEGKKNEVLPALKIIDAIHKYDEEIDLRILGNSEILLDVQGEVNEHKILSILKTIIISFSLFFGAALAIINFHVDVEMDKSLQIVYKIITGEESTEPLVLLIPYSLGIGVGMSVFFNHIFRKKWKKEPSPLEVEMYLYHKNIDDYILDNSKHN